MKIYRSTLLYYALAILFILPLGVDAQTPKAHRHPAKTESMAAEIGKEFSIVETTLETDAEIGNAVKNKARTFEAFTVGGSRIFYKNLKTGRIFEIKGLPSEWRDFSDLVWSNDQTLMFDRWVQPHYGNHYAVNVVRKRLTEAAGFPDEEKLKQQKTKNR